MQLNNIFANYTWIMKYISLMHNTLNEFNEPPEPPEQPDPLFLIGLKLLKRSLQLNLKSVRKNLGEIHSLIRHTPIRL